MIGVPEIEQTEALAERKVRKTESEKVEQTQKTGQEQDEKRTTDKMKAKMSKINEMAGLCYMASGGTVLQEHTHSYPIEKKRSWEQMRLIHVGHTIFWAYGPLPMNLTEAMHQTATCMRRQERSHFT